MAGTRVPKSGKVARDREISDARARKILAEASPESGSSFVRGPKPRTAKDVAKDAARLAVGLDESKLIHNRAASLLRRWSEPTAPQKAVEFWAHPGHQERFGFYRHLHPLASQIVTHQALVDLLSRQPDETLDSEFDPKRQHVVRIASAALIEAAGSTEIVAAYEEQIPVGLKIVTDSSFRWESAASAPFPDRLVSYDARALAEYEASLTERQHVRR